MQIYFKKTFIKQYKRLQSSQQKKVDQALEFFEKNPLDTKLKNHGLVGKLQGKRAISAGFDLRIVFEIQGEYITVTMLAVGTHNQVY